MKSALLVIDVQNAVVDGIESIDEVTARVAGLVQRCRAAGDVVVWVQHDGPDLEVGTHGWELVPGLSPVSGDVMVAKQHRSSFAGTGLGDRLRAAGVGRVVLTGAQSAFCVDMAGKHALAEGFDVTLVSDAHASGPMTTDAGPLTDAQVRGLINRTWSTMAHPRRHVEVVAAGSVQVAGSGLCDRQGPTPDRVSAGGETFTITRARAADVGTLAALLADDVLGAVREGASEAAYLAAFEEIDADPNQFLAVIRDEAGAICGTFQLTLTPCLSRGGTKRLQVEAVRLAPSTRGKGLGTAMFEWAHEYGREHGATLAQLTTDKQRTDAQRFYGQPGYTPSHVGFKRPL